MNANGSPQRTVYDFALDPLHTDCIKQITDIQGLVDVARWLQTDVPPTNRFVLLVYLHRAIIFTTGKIHDDIKRIVNADPELTLTAMAKEVGNALRAFLPDECFE